MRAAALAAELSGRGADATPVHLPLDNPEALKQGIARVASAQPLPRAVALCGAPAPDVAPFAKLALPAMRRQVECAVLGNYTLCAELWRACFRRQGGGHVLAVLSAAQGPATASHMAGYVASKGGLEALLHAAAAELGRAGLRVSVVRPGYVDTPMLKAFQPMLLDRARESLSGGDFLAPEQVADALMRGLSTPGPGGTVQELSIDTAVAAQ